MAPRAKNGPNGIILVFLIFNTINDIGRPIIDPRKIESRACGHPRINPKKNNNFISPPPIDSV